VIIFACLQQAGKYKHKVHQVHCLQDSPQESYGPMESLLSSLDITKNNPEQGVLISNKREGY